MRRRTDIRSSLGEEHTEIADQIEITLTPTTVGQVTLELHDLLTEAMREYGTATIRVEVRES